MGDAVRPHRGCAEDEVEFLTAVYYFYDENKAFIYGGQKSGTEIYWVDSEFEPLSGTPDFDKIKYVKVCVYGHRDWEDNDFASNVTVKVNDKISIDFRIIFYQFE